MPPEPASAPPAALRGSPRLAVGFFAFLVTLIIAGTAGALLVSGYRTRAEDAARRDVQVIGTSVARALAQQFEKAARFGIPLKLLPGVETHLAETLARTPGMTQIVLRGPDGREIRSAIGDSPGTDSVSAPVTVDGYVVATVEVTTSPAALSDAFSDLGLRAALVILGGALAAGIAGGLFAGGALRRSQMQMAGAMARNIAGEFETSGQRVTGTARGAVNSAFRALIQGSRRVDDRRTGFEAYAEELLAVDFDGTLRPDIERVRREVLARPNVAAGERGR